MLEIIEKDSGVICYSSTMDEDNFFQLFKEASRYPRLDDEGEFYVPLRIPLSKLSLNSEEGEEYTYELHIKRLPLADIKVMENPEGYQEYIVRVYNYSSLKACAAKSPRYNIALLDNSCNTVVTQYIGPTFDFEDFIYKQYKEGQREVLMPVEWLPSFIRYDDPLGYTFITKGYRSLVTVEVRKDGKPVLRLHNLKGIKELLKKEYYVD